MGIKGICKWLRDKHPDLFQNVPLNIFNGKKLAVDASVYLYKFISPSNTYNTNWFDMFIGFILHLTKFNIIPVFVFDGKPPDDKNSTKEKRSVDKYMMQQKILEINDLLEKLEEYPVNKDLTHDLQTRVDTMLQQDTFDMPRKQIVTDLYYKSKKYQGQCIIITPQDTNKIKNLITYLGLPWFQAPSEAEKYCVWLAYHDLVQGVITIDSDVIAYQCPIFIKDVVSKSDQCSILCYDDLLNALDMTPQQVTDLCIMCGTDYNDNIPKCGCNGSYKLLQEHGSIDNITEHDTTILKHVRVREIFTLYDKPDAEFIIPFKTSIDERKLQLLLFKTNSKYSVDYIKSCMYEAAFHVT